MNLKQKKIKFQPNKYSSVEKHGFDISGTKSASYIKMSNSCRTKAFISCSKKALKDFSKTFATRKQYTKLVLCFISTTVLMVTQYQGGKLS